jgi:hypothetical protein
MKLLRAFCHLALCLSVAFILTERTEADEALSIDFYGKKVGLLKLFGQEHWGDYAPGQTNGATIYHAAGVVVDRSLTPNAIYIADTGNNRILGFRSYDSKKADLVFGQPDEFAHAPNGDGNMGSFGKATATTLCLINIPANTNLAEQWMRLNFDVDKAGNLYVPDHGNNRVLIYYAPFSADKRGGKGDTVPDFVLGQSDFTSNGINHGLGAQKCDAQSLFISYGNSSGFDHVSCRGVSVDEQGNVWVADTFNSRVLRFPRGQAVADLVLGQAGFSSNGPARNINDAPLRKMCTPTLARINPATGELYVVDEYGGGFPSRILVFPPPFTSGMAASRVLIPQQELAGDYAAGYRFTHCSGLIFNPIQTDDWVDEEKKTARYRDGVLWVHDQTRTLLLDKDGHILLAIGATDLVSKGWSDRMYSISQLNNQTPFNVRWAGGMMGFDSANNIYLADERYNRIARYALPWRPRVTDRGLALPTSNGGLVGPNITSPDRFAPDRVGIATLGNQLIVRDEQRYLVWTDYLTRPDKRPADLVIGQDDGWSLKQRNHIMGRATQAIDHHQRLWATGEHGALMAYQLPFIANAKPLREMVPLYWADQPDKVVDYRCGEAVACDAASQTLWLYDSSHYRLLRIHLPDNVQDKLLVDAVIGQANKTDGALNRGQNRPSAASFADVDDIKFDSQGNLFVVDNTYELHNNGRVIAFAATDLAAINTLFPDIKARWVYVASDFNEPVGERKVAPGPQPFSPVRVAFNSRNEMVIGNDGYLPAGIPEAKRHWNQLFLYRKPLEQPTPDAIIELPLGAPGEMTFDQNDNFIVQDHTWNKVWVLNFDKDAAWLRPLRLPAIAPPANALWLDGLDVSKMTAGNGRSAQARTSVAGGLLQLNGKPYAQGIGTNALSEFVVDLKGAATRFTSTVGLDEAAGNQGAVVFEVWVDNEMASQSPILRRGATYQFNVDLTGAQLLGLRVTGGGQETSRDDQANWCEALLYLDPRIKNKPEAIHRQ